MQTFMVQVIEGRNGRFEDLYVEARTDAEAIRKARKLTTIDLRWARFIV